METFNVSISATNNSPSASVLKFLINNTPFYGLFLLILRLINTKYDVVLLGAKCVYVTRNKVVVFFQLLDYKFAYKVPLANVLIETLSL